MTNAELAILSLVAEQPRHGYEIEQVIEARGMRDWTEVGFSSIYYLLRKLEQDGLIESRITQATGRGPARKIFSLTQQGRAAWQAETLAVLSTPHPNYPAFQLGLANLPAIPLEALLSALQAYQAALAERIAYVETRRLAQLPLPEHVAWMFDYSLMMLKAELDWIAGLIPKLSSHPSHQEA